MKYRIMKEGNNLKRLSLCVMENLTVPQHSSESALRKYVLESMCLGFLDDPHSLWLWLALFHSPTKEEKSTYLLVWLEGKTPKRHLDRWVHTGNAVLLPAHSTSVALPTISRADILHWVQLSNLEITLQYQASCHPETTSLFNINLGKLVTPFPNTIPSNCSVEAERGDGLKMEHQGLFPWQAILKPVPVIPISWLSGRVILSPLNWSRFTDSLK